MVFEAGLILQGMKVLIGGALVVLPVPGASSLDFRSYWYSILLSLSCRVCDLIKINYFRGWVYNFSTKVKRFCDIIIGLLQ